jgi:hypothetical protein
MGKILNDFIGGGQRSNRAIAQIGTGAGNLGRKIAPTLQPEHLKAVYRAGGIWAMPGALVLILQIIGFFVVSGTSIFAPIFAWIFISPWAKWLSVKYGHKLTVAEGWIAFRDSVWVQRRGMFWVMLVVYAGGQLFGWIALAVMSNSIGGNTSLATAISWIGNAIFFFIYRSLVKTSIMDFLAGQSNQPDEDAIFRANVAAALGIKPEIITKSNFRVEGSGFVIDPVPDAALNYKMAENIATRAEKILPGYELVEASAREIRFVPITAATAQQRNVAAASGGLIVSRSDAEQESYFRAEDFE